MKKLLCLSLILMPIYFAQAKITQIIQANENSSGGRLLNQGQNKGLKQERLFEYFLKNDKGQNLGSVMVTFSFNENPS